MNTTHFPYVAENDRVDPDVSDSTKTLRTRLSSNDGGDFGLNTIIEAAYARGELTAKQKEALIERFSQRSP